VIGPAPVGFSLADLSPLNAAFSLPSPQDGAGSTRATLRRWPPRERLNAFNGYERGEGLIYLVDMCTEKVLNSLFFESWFTQEARNQARRAI
jgi:hypothetical protein